MPVTYQNLLLSAINNALRGIEANLSPAIDAIGIADTLFPIVSQAVSEAAAADPYKRSLLRRVKTVTLVAGQATLTDDVLTKFFSDATLLGTSLSSHYAYRDYPDFVRKGDTRLGYFTRNGTTLMVRDVGQSFTVPLTATGARTLVVPSVVVKPALSSDNVDCPDEIASDLDEALANALRGALIKEAGATA